jgi:hypothetical protein
LVGIGNTPLLTEKGDATSRKMARRHFIWSGRGGRSQAKSRCERPPRLRRFGSFATFLSGAATPPLCEEGITSITAVAHQSYKHTAAAEPAGSGVDQPEELELVGQPRPLARLAGARTGALLHHVRERHRCHPSKRCIACHQEGTSWAAPCLRLVLSRSREIFRLCLPYMPSACPQASPETQGCRPSRALRRCSGHRREQTTALSASRDPMRTRCRVVRAAPVRRLEEQT